jgi:hypothetical protein
VTEGGGDDGDGTSGIDGGSSNGGGSGNGGIGTDGKDGGNGGNGGGSGNGGVGTDGKDGGHGNDIRREGWRIISGSEVRFMWNITTVKFGKILVLQVLEETFLNHRGFELRDSIVSRSSPQDPLCWCIPLVPKVSPYLSQVVPKAKLIHVSCSSLMYFLPCQVSFCLVIKGNFGMLISMDVEFLNDSFPKVLWAKGW